MIAALAEQRTFNNSRQYEPPLTLCRASSLDCNLSFTVYCMRVAAYVWYAIRIAYHISVSDTKGHVSHYHQHLGSKSGLRAKIMLNFHMCLGNSFDKSNHSLCHNFQRQGKVYCWTSSVHCCLFHPSSFSLPLFLEHHDTLFTPLGLLPAYG